MTAHVHFVGPANEPVPLNVAPTTTALVYTYCPFLTTAYVLETALPAWRRMPALAVLCIEYVVAYELAAILRPLLESLPHLRRLRVRAASAEDARRVVTDIDWTAVRVASPHFDRLSIRALSTTSSAQASTARRH